MAAFVKNDITDKGLALLAKVQMGEKLTFSKIGIGSGVLPGTTSIRSLTAMIQPVMDVTITRKKINEDQTVTIGGIFNNTDVQQEFYFRELALYAIDPNLGEILYCYGNAGNGAELIPAHDTQTLVEKIIDIVTYIGDATEVNALMKTEAYASAKDLETLSDEVEQVKLEVSDIQDKLVRMQQSLDLMGVHVYTHTKEGTVHNFAGEGATGRAKITADFNPGDTIQLNGEPVTGTSGSEPVNGDTLVKGQWVLFVADAEGGQINFKGGGGLSDSKLNQATATADHVWVGDTFYAKGSKAVQTGTLDVPGATAAPEDVVAGETFFAGSAEKKTGTLQDQPSRTDALTLSAVQSDGYMLARIPKGAYRTPDASGYPVIGVSQSDVFNSLNLSEKGGVTRAVSVYDYGMDNVGIRIPAGIYKTPGDGEYPVITASNADLIAAMNIISHGGFTNAASVYNYGGSRVGIRIPKGLYDTEGNSGYPVILAYNTDVMDAIGLNSQAGMTEAVSNYEIDEDTVGLRIPSGLYQTAGDSGYPVIKEPINELSWIVKPFFHQNTENSNFGSSYSLIGYSGEVFAVSLFITRPSGIDSFYFGTEPQGNCEELFKDESKIQDQYGNTVAREITVIVRFTDNSSTPYIISFGNTSGQTLTIKSIQLVGNR